MNGVKKPARARGVKEPAEKRNVKGAVRKIYTISQIKNLSENLIKSGNTTFESIETDFENENTTTPNELEFEFDKPSVKRRN